MSELEDYYHEFQQNILLQAEADESYKEDAFFDIFCEYLTSTGELLSADRAFYQAQRGMRVDGYGGDPLENDNVLSLIITDYNTSTQVETLIQTEMNAIFKRLTNYLEKSLDVTWRNSLEETNPAFGLADLISRRWNSIDKVKLFLLSNRQLSERVDGRKADEIEGVPVVYNVWDIGRLHRFVSSGRGREEIEIDLEKDYGGAIPALPAHLMNASYEAYIAVVPGVQLAAIYDRWGARLLEQNVRVFLQARGGVNKGIRNTIENDPEMFFAYNNGITATAESVVRLEDAGALQLTNLKNLQIVNGGQTTASIHAASKKKIDLSNVFVQMKLSIIAPEKTEEVVPRISEYANSQNRVNAADFFSNHPYHVRMEGISRHLLAPSPDGSFRESKWFYERARGQYMDVRMKLKPSDQRKFDLESPKTQRFDKTDLAKYENTWIGLPHIVCKGSQKNFANFASRIGDEWDKNADQFNEQYFRHLIVKAIIHCEVMKIVKSRPWFEGAYRSAFVPYTIARFAADVECNTFCFDYDAVWKTQHITEKMKNALTIVVDAIYGVILDPPSGNHNVLEWAKMEACWKRVQGINIPWDHQLLESLRTVADKRDVKKTAVKEQIMINGIQAQIAVTNAGARLWGSVMQWGVEKGILTPIQQSIIGIAATGKTITDKQSIIAIEALKKLHGEGCQLGLEVVKNL